MRPFAALLEALSAFIQNDAQRFELAVRATAPEKLFGHAARHKCAAFLFEGFLRLRPRASELRDLRTMLQRYAGTYALEATAAREQISGVAGALRCAGLPSVLLKSSAMLYSGDGIAERSQVFDLDVMIRECDADAAVAALSEAGYSYERPELAAGYRTLHHHLAPLVNPAYKKALELHLALTPPGAFSTRSGWNEFAAHQVSCDGPSGPAVRLDAFGSALHYALHGAGVHRLGDAVQIARIVAQEPRVLDELIAAAAGERVQRVALQSVLALASRLAGLQRQFDPAVRQYVGWAQLREDLPRVYRGRTQLTDAWFANGCSLAGPNTRLAFPPAYANDGRRIGTLQRARIIAGRLLAGSAAAVHWVYLQTA